MTITELQDLIKLAGSQERLARQVGCSKQTIRNLLRGGRPSQLVERRLEEVSKELLKERLMGEDAQEYVGKLRDEWEKQSKNK